MPARKSRVQDLLFENDEPVHVMADAFAEVEGLDLLVECVKMCKDLTEFYREICLVSDHRTPRSGTFKIWNRPIMVKHDLHFSHIELKANNGQEYIYCINAKTSQVCRICAVHEVMEV